MSVQWTDRINSYLTAYDTFHKRNHRQPRVSHIQYNEYIITLGWQLYLSLRRHDPKQNDNTSQT